MTRSRAVLIGVATLAPVSTAALGAILLDASNMQLALRPGLSNLGLASSEQPHLAARLDALSKLFEPAPTVEAIFDGTAFDGEHLGGTWLCDPEVPDASLLRVRFTDRHDSADDALVRTVQALGSTADATPAEAISSGRARTLLEASPMAKPAPTFAVTLLKSAMGKSKRDKREAFLRTCGLTRMGDTVHLPTFLPSQQERSLALVRGLHSLERGVVSVAQITQPVAMVVSDDRGLRRRCFGLALPPVVMGRSQFYNMLDRIMLDRSQEPQGASA